MEKSSCLQGILPHRGWALCDGQLLSISANQALFSILGTTYGGDGRTTFALPDLRGRTPIHPGHGPGLSAYRLGQRGGQENVTLNVTQMPVHNHLAMPASGSAPATITGSGTIKADSTAATNNPDGKYPATAIDENGGGVNAYGSTADINMATGGVTFSGTATINNIPAPTIGNTGGSQSHTNMQPFECVNFIIALVGIFPSRN